MTPTVLIPSNDIRKPVVAGQFYPESPSLLRQQIDEFQDHAEIARIDGEILGLVVPHAGYMYSGQTAATAYKQVAGRHVEVVIILAPSHRDAFDGGSVYTGSGYETPFGVVPVDRARALRLIAQDPEMLHETFLGHGLEHSIEVQLPFLQRVLAPSWSLIPVMMCDRSYEVCTRLASAIAAVSSGTSILIVASSDLYHGYSYTDCTGTDHRTLSSLERFDPQEFLRGLHTKAYAACGGGPIAVAMLAAQQLGANAAHVVAHTTSSDVTGRREGYVVGYGAAVLYRKATDSLGEQTIDSPHLNDMERQQLLMIARMTIAQCAYGAPASLTPFWDVTSEKLLTPGGAFVTIRRGGALRGCIGYIQPVKSLYLTVQDMAKAAATQDPRFPPVMLDELTDLAIEISVLGPLKRLERLDDLQVGTHGLYIRGYGTSGLLLPQVATEHGWDRETFLSYTCQKAKLPPEAWKSPTVESFFFKAEVFGN